MLVTEDDCTAAASPILPQPNPSSPKPPTPQSPLPPQQPSHPSSTVPPALPLPSSQSPPRADSLETSRSCSPHTLPPPSPRPEDHSQEEVPTIQNGIETVGGVKVELEDENLSNLSTQSQSQIESTPAADRQQPGKESPDAGEEEREESGVTGRISDDEVEEEERGGEVAKQEDQSGVEEEELVSPVLDLDASFDKEVMELMTSSSPPPSFLHLSSPSPPPLSSRGKGRTLRPPPCSSRPSDDLSIRLRQSPFSTEASPETSPARTPVTPPPLSPPSPHFRSSPSARETVPLNKVN